MRTASKEFLEWVDWYSEKNNIPKSRPLLAEDRAFVEGAIYAKYNKVKPSFHPSRGPSTTQINDAFGAGVELENRKCKQIMCNLCRTRQGRYDPDCEGCQIRATARGTRLARQIYMADWRNAGKSPKQLSDEWLQIKRDDDHYRNIFKRCTALLRTAV